MKRVIIIQFIAIAIMAVFPLVAGYAVENQQEEEIFFQANQAYKEKRFQDAIEGYLQLIGSGYANGHLYYNLGNAYFRFNQLGRSILNYERARILIPRDADLNFNLGFGRDRTRDAIAEHRGIINIAFFWIDALSKGELFTAFAVLNLMLWLILLIRLFHHSEWTYYGSLLILICWLVTGTSFGLKWYQSKTDDRAVILAKEVDVLAGPASEDTVLFKLHEGTVVRHEREEDGWVLVRLPDKKRGWIMSKALENIKQKQGVIQAPSG